MPDDRTAEATSFPKCLCARMFDVEGVLRTRSKCNGRPLLHVANICCSILVEVQRLSFFSKMRKLMSSNEEIVEDAKRPTCRSSLISKVFSVRESLSDSVDANFVVIRGTRKVCRRYCFCTCNRNVAWAPLIAGVRSQGVELVPK